MLTNCPTDRLWSADQPLVGRAAAADVDDGTVAYFTHCPDVLEVSIADHPEANGPRRVSADGRIDLGALGRLRVEGRTTTAIAAQLAMIFHTDIHNVRVAVTEHNSQQVYLFGQINGSQRPVSYRGPETVVELLQRVGGITAGAAPDDVYVVRPRVGPGLPPEVFHVELRRILVERDERTNLRLQPFDEVHVGETKRSLWGKCVPPCLKPLYQGLCGLGRRVSLPGVNRSAEGDADDPYKNSRADATELRSMQP